MLDDPKGGPRKVGESYSDLEIISQLDISTLDVTRFFYENRAIYRLQRLIKVEQLPILGDPYTYSNFADGLFVLRCTFGRVPARIYTGGLGDIFEAPDHYAVMVEGSDLVFVGGLNLDAWFWYIKKPRLWGGNFSLDHIDFERSVYNAIAYHAAGTLAIKNEGTEDARTANRYLTYYGQLIGKLAEASSMQIIMDEVVM